MMPTAQPFDKNMWSGFSGCERWPDGSLPVYRSVGDWLIVADSFSVEAHYQGNQLGDDDTWFLDFTPPSQKVALALLNGLGDDFHPAEYGFDLR